MSNKEKLALLGGNKAVTENPGNMFTWPIITEEDEEAALGVLRRGAMSGTEITRQFEDDFTNWLDVTYALAFNNGTASLQAAMYGCGLGVGDEIIGPSITYWGSALQAFSLSATVVFADIDPVTLCLDPNDIEHRISERTKAIMVVHYLGHPADMDAIMGIAHKHNLKVIEDVSHAHGGLYKGRKLGTIGHVGAMSLMAGKALAVGEGGMLVTNDRSIYERALVLGHYERFNKDIESPDLQPYKGLPMGGYKYRMHQISSAVGRVQLKHYDERHAEISRSMNYFWDLLEDVPGIRAHRPEKGSDIYMGGWYAAHGHYKAEELGGLSISRFCEAVRAEGVGECNPGCNRPLHLHLLLQDADVYGHGMPTRIANAARDVRPLDNLLPVSERIAEKVFSIPWFKHFRPEVIEAYANAFRKAAGNYRELLAEDQGNALDLGDWSLYKKK
ncbi:DegT/DnrJ/EryC1/StrS family aminotransferase [Paenibacillus qinlingensis]|uniref:DegT/DnrJ/EryC1/StrS aminotransferase family protein n=1 Tax=Paenibacillus qinlingensis TaxID=1837343 RepID=UPI0015638B2A|nr:DegT/DnrJ/EryC1/StrS family aminotransferase [Paenibacillus qinlingensis]NQX64238.1 DegT/DnrJ/EryC1/StrS family aminotransferase [Paenibacillus qinlingensis]